MRKIFLFSLLSLAYSAMGCNFVKVGQTVYGDNPNPLESGVLQGKYIVSQVDKYCNIRAYNYLSHNDVKTFMKNRYGVAVKNKKTSDGSFYVGQRVNAGGKRANIIAVAQGGGGMYVRLEYNSYIYKTSSLIQNK